MANYIFESITQAQAVGFTSADSLIFLTSSTTAASVTVSPATAPSGSAAPSGTDYGTVISDGTHTITFPSAAISGASTADHLLFNDGSHLIIGLNSSTADTLTSTSTATDTASTVIYGLGGNDTINLGAGPDYAYGGLGDDTIGSATANGNYHIYGNATGGSSTLPTGSTDVDTITAGSGSSYIQGNQGNDVIAVGTATSTGYNRIFGGADNDQITVNGGMGSHAAVNGNKGDDTITDASSGTNTLRGGQGNDTIVQTGASHDMIMGDMGSDILRVSGVQGHVAVLTGGSDGGDTFDFSQVGAGSVAHLDSTGANVTGTTSGGVTTYAAGTQTFYQEITDFQSSDHIQVQFSSAQLSTATIGHSNTVFASVSDAQTYAETQLTGNTLVSALTAVGADNMQHTYLFYHDAAGSTTADGVIQLDGVAASSVTVSAFQAAGTV